MALELSILICATSSRLQIMEPLIKSLAKQMIPHNESVEILIDYHEFNTVGKKRGDLLRRANGKYCVAIDTDDEIADNYIELVLEACKLDSDCIGINGVITTNGVNPKVWFISKEYGKWFEKDSVYYRTPNHISPVKTELALLAGFPDISFGEDYEYSMRLLPLLNSETIITEPLYHYKYNSNK